MSNAGILLAPWFLLYAASSVVLNHRGWFEGKSGEKREWVKKFERKYQLPPLADDVDTDELAEKILRDNGLTGRYRAGFNDDENFVIQRNRLLSTIQLTYYPTEGRLVAEERRLPVSEFLTAAHFRAGFVYPYFIEVLWAIFVDLVVLATLIWIGSGLYMWIKFRRCRLWGWVALASGAATFLALVFQL